MKRLLALSTLLILLPTSVVFAAEEEPVVEYACVQALMTEGETLVNDYGTFAQEYVQEETPTSGQVEVLISFYRYIRVRLTQIYEENSKIDGTKTQALAKEEANTCAYYRDQYVDFAQVLLQSSIEGAAAWKPSFKMLDAAKIIVSGLEDLSLPFAEVFPASLDDFNNALPCYAKECI